MYSTPYVISTNCKTMNLSIWMSQLDDYLKNRPVIHLAIPGSHDSMSYTITPTADIAPDSSSFVQTLARIFGSPCRRVVYQWVITQELNVLQQLHFGIRYFDLRVSTHKTDSNLYFVHGMYGSEISENLKTINEYLEKYTEEIVILDFQHFYNFTSEDHQRLRELLKTVYGGKLCALPWDIMTVTMAWMLDHGYRVIVVYRHDSCERDDRFWPSVRWPTPWPETTSVDHMLQFLEKMLKYRPKNAGFVTQCVLTPDTKFVVRNLCSDLRASCSIPCFNGMIPWLEKQKPGPRGVNVVIADFVEHQAETFSKVVVSLNDSLKS